MPDEWVALSVTICLIYTFKGSIDWELELLLERGPACPAF